MVAHVSAFELWSLHCIVLFPTPHCHSVYYNCNTGVPIVTIAQGPEERTSSRRSIFLPKDNRHNLLHPRYMRVYIMAAMEILMTAGKE